MNLASTRRLRSPTRAGWRTRSRRYKMSFDGTDAGARLTFERLLSSP
jgi:hypothetical protein